MNDYHLGKPGSCFPDDTLVINKMSIDECGKFHANNGINVIINYCLLKDGGIEFKTICC